ncbi:MAG: AAA family ATPase [Thermoguttaceae bacterium]|nr:AAA family ATPase [Thermoguttaceae bacterium]MDW8038812.1 AAA family ATPase [Thermoguttaceae bacterium]
MIRRIRIQNFKSLRDVTVELSPVTVFIGKSGTGKTNFVSAIRFLRDYLWEGKVPGYVQDQRLWQCATNPKEPTEFTVHFTIPAIDPSFTYRLRLAGEDWRLSFEQLVWGTEIVFCQSERERKLVHQLTWEVPPEVVGPPEPGLVALGRLPGVEAAVLAHTALTAGIGVYNFPYNALQKSGQASPGFGLADRAENYLQVLRQLLTDLENIETRKAMVATLQWLNPTILSIQPDSIQNPQKVIVGHRLGEKILPLDLAQESDGFRRFFAHLLALYQKPSKQTLVFEEPENGIYPAALELLANEFKAAPEAGRGQVLLTTHSPLLLDQFSAEHIRVVELVDLETRIGPLAEDQREALREQLLHPGELFTVDPARIASIESETAG